MTTSLKAEIQTAVEILKAYGAKRVILFGSAARSLASPRDIDLACEGLPPARFFEALGKLLSALSVPVDLVDLKEVELSPSLQQRIRREGVLLYEAR
jgi:predicted nucleotidyltransferase